MGFTTNSRSPLADRPPATGERGLGERGLGMVKVILVVSLMVIPCQGPFDQPPHWVHLAGAFVQRRSPTGGGGGWENWALS